MRELPATEKGCLSLPPPTGRLPFKVVLDGKWAVVVNQAVEHSHLKVVPVAISVRSTTAPGVVLLQTRGYQTTLCLVTESHKTWKCLTLRYQEWILFDNKSIQARQCREDHNNMPLTVSKQCPLRVSPTHHTTDKT